MASKIRIVLAAGSFLFCPPPCLRVSLPYFRVAHFRSMMSRIQKRFWRFTGVKNLPTGPDCSVDSVGYSVFITAIQGTKERFDGPARPQPTYPAKGRRAVRIISNAIGFRFGSQLAAVASAVFLTFARIANQNE
uniref:Uncharacterized protein n=1 Tax=Anopheles farauti TaxID=69004 RepID=A0A182QSU6_9DIPT